MGVWVGSRVACLAITPSVQFSASRVSYLAVSLAILKKGAAFGHTHSLIRKSLFIPISPPIRFSVNRVKRTSRKWDCGREPTTIRSQIGHAMTQYVERVSK